MQAVLIGFMGCGKTTVGRALATELRTEHADLDELIVAEAGRPITTIFADSGEATFRRLERETLRQTLARTGVLSTGGGTAVSAANAELLAASRVPVIWLTASDQTTLARVQNDAQRPLVNQLDVEGLLALKHQRAPRYEQAADLVVATDQRTPVQIVSQIAQWLALRTE
ncbi:shikimate kinase [Lactiplantibacillus modestisalitolerans]|uniref:Shikimate kinase n=1 Tax=Lactiplantibacillus modestisalitolerans TaxID=1457219 RepID=A0ABV5WUR9_9LACO|nr:shikimate kinase [Lactiplantibacillus modestisalitolerans]